MRQNHPVQLIKLEQSERAEETTAVAEVEQDLQLHQMLRSAVVRGQHLEHPGQPLLQGVRGDVSASHVGFHPRPAVGPGVLVGRRHVAARGLDRHGRKPLDR